MAGTAWGGAPDLQLTRVVGTGDAVPGLPGAQFLYAWRPQLGGDYAVFYGFTSFAGGTEGYYIANTRTGAVSRLVDTIMAAELPGALPDMFVWLFDENYDVGANGLAAIIVNGEDPGGNVYGGVFQWRDGTLVPIALTGQPAPGSGGAVFERFVQVRVDGEAVYFRGLPAEQPNFLSYRWLDGALEYLDYSPIEFAGEHFMPGFGGTVITGFDSAQGTPSGFGIWLRRGDGLLAEIFDLGDTPYHGGSGHFRTAMLQPGIVAGGLAILAQDSGLTGGRGLFRVWHDNIELVIRSGVPDPITGLPLSLWSEFSASGERIAYYGTVPGELQHRVRVQDPDRSIRKVIDYGDPLDGEFVADLDLKWGGLDGDRLALGIIRQTDAAVWIADLDPGAGGGGPSPLEIPTLHGPGLLVLAMVLAGVGLWAQRR